LQVLDSETILRIKDCKRHGFPICLEEAFSHIFREQQSELLINRYVEKLHLRLQNIESAEQIWKIYDLVLLEAAEELGKDVSQVIEFQSLKEMEKMKGCASCPLYRRQVETMAF
jgi:hypothetical protein